MPPRWVVTYRGTGTIEHGERARLVDRAPHRDLIEIYPGSAGHATLSITATDPADPLRKIRVTPAGRDAQERWTSGGPPSGV